MTVKSKNIYIKLRIPEEMFERIERDRKIMGETRTRFILGCIQARFNIHDSNAIMKYNRTGSFL